MRGEVWLAVSLVLGIAAVLWGQASAGTAGAAGEKPLSCPLPHPESAVGWSAPEGSQPPPIDQRAPAHLKVATFALG